MDENNDINEVPTPTEEPVIDVPQPEPTPVNTASDPVSEPINQTTNNTTSNGGKKLPIIPIVAVIVVVLLLVIGLGGKAKSPDKFFMDVVGKGLDLIVDTANTEKSDNVKVALDFEVDLGEDMEFFKDTAYYKLITTTKPEISLYTNDSKIEADLHANYDGDDLLNGSMILDIEGKKGVVKLDELSKSYIDLELDEDAFEAMEEYLAEDKKIPAERVKIVKEEVNKHIVAEHATKASEKIEIDGKTVNTTVYTYKTDLKSLFDGMIDVCENLKDNEKYLKTFDDDEDPKEVLDDTIDTLKEAGYTEDDIIEIKVYLKGNSAVKVLCTLTAKDESVVEASVVMPKKGVYDYALISKQSEDDDEPESIEGTVTVDKDGSKAGTVTFSGKYDVYSAKVIVKYEKLDKKDISSIDSLDVKAFDDLTEEEIEGFTESKLYEVIMDVTGYGSSSYYDDDDYYSSYSYDDDDDDYYSWDYEDDDEEDDYSYSFDSDDYDWNF